jgi:hypothetical protein
MLNQSGKAACALRKRPQYRGGCFRRCLKIRQLHHWMTCLCLCPLMTLCCQKMGNCFARAGWIDPDTPQQYRTTEPLTKGDDREFQLVRWSNAWMSNQPFGPSITREQSKGLFGLRKYSTVSCFCICEVEISDEPKLQ